MERLFIRGQTRDGCCVRLWINRNLDSVDYTDTKTIYTITQFFSHLTYINITHWSHFSSKNNNKKRYNVTNIFLLVNEWLYMVLNTE